MLDGEKAPRILVLGRSIEGFDDGLILVEGREVDDDSPLTHAMRAWLLSRQRDLLIDRGCETLELL